MGILKKFFGSAKQNTEQIVEQPSETKPGIESDGSKGNAILDFYSCIQQIIEWEKLEDVEFGMWIPSENDKTFGKSPITEKWSEIYSVTKHHWSYITADFLKLLNVLDEETFRIGLPENFQAFAFLTRENEQMVFSVSQEKGIRFHFAETSSLEYRLQFMDNFITYCKAWKGLITENNGEQDEDLEYDKWWELTLKTSAAVEEKEPLTGVGKIMK
ncbi:hypothetical protein D3C87_95400 [compost metagenome]